MGAEASEKQRSGMTQSHAFSDIAKAFKEKVDRVYDLAEFDHVILGFAIRTLERVVESATASEIAQQHRQNVAKELQHLRDIRKNDSLRSKYQHIFNQCVVLLVSYFGSTIRDLFADCVAERLTSNTPQQKLLDEELKLSVAELLEVSSDEQQRRVGDLLIRKCDISFQDMQSIGKAFSKYCDYGPEKGQDCNNIILGQACRHVIVHSGATIDEKCLKQVKAAMPRTLKLNLAMGPVQFSVEELKVLGESMKAYVKALVAGLGTREPEG